MDEQHIHNEKTVQEQNNADTQHITQYFNSPQHFLIRLFQARSQYRPTQQNHSDTVRALHQEYRRQLEHSLQGAAMIAVGLHERTDAIRSSTQLVFRRLSTAVEPPLQPGTSIIQVYDDAKQGLLILGEPGAGLALGLEAGLVLWLGVGALSLS
jgi:hypothetical protein